jgi:hypothetical protein
MRIQVYYESGSYSCYDSTLLSYQDGFLGGDDFLDASDLKGRGLVVLRSVYERQEDDDEVRRARLGEELKVVTPEELEHVYAIVVDGVIQFARIGGILCEVAYDQVMAPFMEDEEE